MPFCRRRCPYCDFYKKVPHSGELETFSTLLEKELIAHAASAPFSNLDVSSVYFGGGTPSLHPPNDITNLLNTIRRLWPVNIDAEITLEANPGTIGLNEMETLLSGGVNRLSLGIQSFSDRKLKLLFRDHDARESQTSFKLARRAGFKNISVDLIYGLPGETIDEWQRDLDEVLDLAPEHVSLYNLEYHKGTPFYRWRESGKLVPLDDEIELELYLAASEKLSHAGFEHYEISNLARPSFRSHHNLHYWTGNPYLGVGPSAHSYDGKRTRFENPADLVDWEANLRTSEVLNDEQYLLEWLSLRLRLSDGLNYKKTVETIGASRAEALWLAAKNMDSKFVQVDHENLILKPRGWFCQNDIILLLYKNIT
ncbi:radical SAM family heme chaperone HemW [bacterium]|nr:radical SAM family heme chaperone HemW [bacterium]